MDDPLAAPTQATVDHTKLVRWNQTNVPEYNMVIDNPDDKKKSPFAYNREINQKIVLWSGDITALDTEAILHSTNETLSDVYPASERLLKRAGPDLQKDLSSNVKVCRTGEARLTKGYQLPARYVIHTVGPRYNLKYKTAAESALFNSYRSVLQIVREKQMSSVALCCIHASRRGYPPQEGAHIALRTVRRFLEKYGDTIDTVVFVVTGEDEDVYISLLPLYFPRSEHEEDFAAYQLPDDVGNEDGEPVIKERQIRIMGKPAYEAQKFNWKSPEELEESININEAFDTSIAVGAHSFSKMDDDIDKKRRIRLQYETHIALLNKEQYKRYEKWLKRSYQEDLSPMESLRCLYQSGFDVYGRPVVVFIGRHFPATKIDLDKFTLYLVQLMDNIVNKPYVIVYFHTLTQSDNHLDAGYLRSLYNLLDSRYKQNLGAVYVVHPTFWSKVMTWFFMTFNTTDLKSRIHNIPGLEYLFKRIPMDQLDIPDFISDYDIQVHGTRYYNPDVDKNL
uniref:Ganglioside-induced differentiation-associated protein 2 n=1 Tax=Alvinella pompejana TaxID=6376 RepID=A0A897TGN4_9ANNE|nr:ganglioside-induced differentiation-associated protein 2 [Alvinella pompejana]